MFVLSILLLIAAVVLFFVGRGREVGGGWKIGAVLSAVAAVLAGVFACVHVVSAYEVGVPVTFGKIGKPMTSGVQFESPFTEVTSFSTRPVDLDLYDKDVVEVRSAQGGVLYADITIKWAVIPAKAVELYRLAGSEEAVQERLVLPDSREIIRNVFAKHTSEEGYATAREKIGAEIATLIKARLAPRGIDVTNVNLRNVKPSDKLQDQIDKKIQQEQDTERAVEASRTAKAESERRRIEAEGIARANEILAKSLSDKVLYNQCLEAYREAAKAHPVYAVPCGTDAKGTPVIVDGSKN
ncbi:prohibitin family protein [Streptomyces turgidiscabies]|uniref:Regulator of protease activity HflC (Stomatin/prohibitin superfamily) n=1 Tax=Streptomyces turgidiscabies TaxID=85558 RepID=A0ABU0RUD4_9ACTN|nr:prohibitin family protein [Streptomyces turgidiscabies]MDQ0934530.1 regulator of protease activity HflC (stomatin/prohibitin superfamily) [Streptomyces turgidiscabies]